MINAKVIADSISPVGVRLTTLQLTYPRFAHAEFLAHRVFSRNDPSSCDMPIGKVVEQVRNDPAMPVYWIKQQRHEETREELAGHKRDEAVGNWVLAAEQAADAAEAMMKAGLHPRVASRVLEPFQLVRVVVTATEWDNFFALHDYPEAQHSEIQTLAHAMKKVMGASDPIEMHERDWHLPYVLADEYHRHSIATLLMMSAARCARVSYLDHDGNEPDIGKDIKLYGELIRTRPSHKSPIEHQAECTLEKTRRFGNFRGWRQYRKIFESDGEKRLAQSR